jgi:hypothetical protein
MADTKKGRDKQARDADKRQQERELRESQERADEPEPPLDEADDAGDEASTRRCHRRGCDEPAAFVVLERYQEETGQGAVEAEAYLCADHTAEESPTNLDGAYEDYVFRVVPVPGTTTGDTE